VIPVFRPPLNERLKSAVAETLDSRWWGYGPRCHELESVFTAQWDGTSLATSSCTSALYLAGLALAGRGREVIVPAISFASTSVAFAHAGYDVVVADVDPRTLMLTPATVEPLLTTDTAAVVAVHLYGQRCDVESLASLCRDRGTTLVEDRAHRVALEDPPVDGFACLSFNAVKELPAGEGGLLWCRDGSAALVARRASYLGMDVDPWARSRTARHRDYQTTSSTGLKLRMHDLPAALVLAGLGDMHEETRRRRRIYESYVDNTDLRWLDRGDDDSFLMMVARVPADQRDRIRGEMAALNVATSVHYPSLARHGCPIAAAAVEEVITFPSSAALTDEEVVIVNDVVRRVTSGAVIE